MQSSQMIPFSNSFPLELHNSILLYLSPHELEKQAERADIKDISLELFLQNPAKRLVDASWKEMLEGLTNTLQSIKGAVILSDDQKKTEKDLYRDMYSKNERLLRDVIFYFINTNYEKIEKNKIFIQKVIFHFFTAANKKEQFCIFNEILNKINIPISLNVPARSASYLLFEYLLDINVNFYKRVNSLSEKEHLYEIYKEEDWYHLLCILISTQAPFQVISKAINKAQNEGYFKITKINPTVKDQIKSGFGLSASNGRTQPKEEDFYITTLLLALLCNHSDETILILMENFPNEVIPTLETLRKIEAGKSILFAGIKHVLYHITGAVSVGIALATQGAVILPPAMPYAFGRHPVMNENVVTVFKKSISREQATKTKIKMLHLLNQFEYKKEIILKPDEKKLLLNQLKEKIKAVKTINQCMSLYDEYSNTYYMNNHYWAKTDFLVCSLWNSLSTYTATKKEFISLIRDKIYDFVMQSSYRISFNKPSLYLEACKNIFNHAIFADVHDKQGVNSVTKNLLKERIQALEEMIPGKSMLK